MFDSMKTLLPGAAQSLRTKTYAAASFSECLLLAKQELGAAAVVVSSKTVRRGGAVRALGRTRRRPGHVRH